MSERSISMVTPMVLAVNAGTKTNTRRVINPQPKLERNVRAPIMAPDFWSWSYRDVHHHTTRPAIDRLIEPYCPYGKAGDVLKLKEAAWMWCEKKPDGLTKKGNPKFRYEPIQHQFYQTVFYKADHAEIPAAGDVVRQFKKNKGKVFVWRLKIPRYLPAWAVRTRLQIVSIRVERLQDITEEDAADEGIDTDGEAFNIATDHYNAGVRLNEGTPERYAFRCLWESINGPDSWAANPFVWRIEFKKV